MFTNSILLPRLITSVYDLSKFSLSSSSRTLVPLVLYTVPTNKFDVEVIEDFLNTTSFSELPRFYSSNTHLYNSSSTEKSELIFIPRPKGDSPKISRSLNLKIDLRLL